MFKKRAYWRTFRTPAERSLEVGRQRRPEGSPTGPMIPAHRTFRVLLATTAIVVVSCMRDDRVTSPSSSTPTPPRPSAAALVPSPGTCQASCTLFDNTGPLWSAIANPDSVTVAVPVAALRFAPVAGDSITLQLTADATVLAAIGADEEIDVSDGTVDRRFALRDLQSATTVWRFTSADTSVLQVSLNRAMAAGVEGRVSLTEASAAPVAALVRPWVAPSGTSEHAGLLRADVIPGCDGEAVPIFQDGTYCGVNVHFFQAVPADAFLAAGATFQSDPGHGVSHEITITFSQPVTAVTVTAYDPTFAGNAMSGYDSTGALIGTVPFPGNNMPGTLTTQVGTLSGAIESVHLAPAPLDYVAYSMTVTFAGGSHRALVVTPTVAGLLAPYVPAITTGICGVDERRSSREFQILLQDTVGSSVNPVAGQTVSLALSEVPFSGDTITTQRGRPGRSPSVLPPQPSTSRPTSRGRRGSVTIRPRPRGRTS